MMRKITQWGEEEMMDWVMMGGGWKMREDVMKVMMKWLRQREKVGRGKVGSETWGERRKDKRRKKRKRASDNEEKLENREKKRTKKRMKKRMKVDAGFVVESACEYI